jgi:hypothetical protein
MTIQSLNKEHFNMTKSLALRNPLTNTQSQIDAVENRLDVARSNLRALELDTVTDADILVKKRNALVGDIASLNQQVEVLEKRLQLEEADKTANAHNARCNKVAGILKRRHTHTKRIDDAIAIIGEEVKHIDRIDKEEIASELLGIDSRFDYQRRTFQHLITGNLNSLGVGDDGRLDKSIPLPTVSEHAKKLHDLTLAELKDYPRLVEEEARRQQQRVDEINRNRYT